MKRTLFCFLFLVSAMNAIAQIGPGYLGKRFMFGYGFHFSPALIGSNGSEGSILGRGPNSLGGDPAFNSTHEGFLEFAFKNRTSVGLSCKYYNTTYDNNEYVFGSVISPSSGQLYTFSGIPAGFYQIKGLNYALYFKFYNKRYVAPWGRYFLFGPVINTYKCFYDPATMKIADDNGYNEKLVLDYFGMQGQQYLRGDILFGWGRNRMLGNRVTVDYGINFELFALGFILWDTIGESPLDDFSGEQTTNLNYIEKTSKRRVREVNRFNAYIKFGVLLF